MDEGDICKIEFVYYAHIDRYHSVCLQPFKNSSNMKVPSVDCS